MSTQACTMVWLCVIAHSLHLKKPGALSQKPSAAPVKPTGSKAAAKSRLAAVKAAMKARQQAAETIDSNSEEPQTQTASQPAESVVFDGGFFQVASPARPAGEREPCQHPTLIRC